MRVASSVCAVIRKIAGMDGEGAETWRPERAMDPAARCVRASRRYCSERGVRSATDATDAIANSATASIPKGPRPSSTASVHRHDFSGDEKAAIACPLRSVASPSVEAHCETLGRFICRATVSKNGAPQLTILLCTCEHLIGPVKLVHSERAAGRHVTPPSIEQHCLMIGRSTHRAAVSKRGTPTNYLPVYL
jgi:hypothetical protein